MAVLKSLRSQPAQRLVQAYKQYSGSEKDKVERELRRRFDTGEIKISLPGDLLSKWKSIKK
jgi:hypothetical protein